jgi:hypothetical protein
MAKKYVFDTNTHKAAMQVSLNSIMMGSLFFILTLLWTLDPHRFSPVILTQIVLAIPLLFVSTLAYAKIGYWKESEQEPWEALGWFTNNVGNIFILNSVGLMAATVYPQIANAYFVLIIFLMTVYSWINVYLRPRTLGEKMFKFLFFMMVLVFGGLLPLLRGI